MKLSFTADSSAPNNVRANSPTIHVGGNRYATMEVLAEAVERTRLGSHAAITLIKQLRTERDQFRSERDEERMKSVAQSIEIATLKRLRETDALEYEHRFAQEYSPSAIRTPRGPLTAFELD